MFVNPLYQCTVSEECRKTEASSRPILSGKSVIWGPLQTQVHEYPISWQPRFRYGLQSLGTQVESTQTMVALRGFIWLRCEYVLRCVNEAHTALRWDISESRLVVTNQNQREIDGLSVHFYIFHIHNIRKNIFPPPKQGIR